MAKSKPKRSLTAVGQSQHATEASSRDKFAEVESIAKGSSRAQPSARRVSPQLCCTIEPDDKALLRELTLFLSNRTGKILSTSTVIRSLIRYGADHMDKLSV